MAEHSAAEATKPYLDYLDKEMTIQGVLSAFCVAAAGLALDKILAADKPSDFVKQLQTSGSSYVMGAAVALIGAGLMFYLQRSDLAWLHGQISLAATREMRELKNPPDSYSIENALNLGDSWSLWIRYKWGLTLLAICATECVIAVTIAVHQAPLLKEYWVVSFVPFLLGGIFSLWLRRALKRKDRRS